MWLSIGDIGTWQNGVILCSMHDYLWTIFGWKSLKNKGNEFS